jgi:transcriptional regulator with XRE-family HTH domain
MRLSSRDLHRRGYRASIIAMIRDKTNGALVEWRHRHGITQAQLAHEIGCSRQAIGMLETGRMKLSVAMLRKLRQVTHLSADRLLDGIEHNGFPT